MPSRRGGNSNYGGGNRGGNKGGNAQNSERVGVLTGWINPDEQCREIFDTLEGANFRLVVQEGVEILVDGKPFNGDLRLFRNDNDKGAGPHVNVVGYQK